MEENQSHHCQHYDGHRSTGGGKGVSGNWQSGSTSRPHGRSPVPAAVVPLADRSTNKHFVNSNLDTGNGLRQPKKKKLQRRENNGNIDAVIAAAAAIRTPSTSRRRFHPTATSTAGAAAAAATNTTMSSVTSMTSFGHKQLQKQQQNSNHMTWMTPRNISFEYGQGYKRHCGPGRDGGPFKSPTTLCFERMLGAGKCGRGQINVNLNIVH